MAGQRERRGRAAERAQTQRQLRVVYFGTGAVLLVAFLAILIGIYITAYLPPRAAVASVDGDQIQARDVVDRGVYYVFYGGGAASLSDAARATVDLLIEDELLRRLAPDLVGEVTPADVSRRIEIDLGLRAEPTPEPTHTPEATADPDATATAEAGATPAASATPEGSATAEATATELPVDISAFANALTDFLRTAKLTRSEYESIVETNLYRDRLLDYFEEQVGDSGPQVHLRRIRLSTQLAADTVLERLAEGEDFATLADEESVAEEDGEGGEFGWTTTDLLEPPVRDALAGLAPGEWSASVPQGLFVDIYLLAEAEADREYDPAVLEELASARLDDWFAEAELTLEVQRGLSPDEESWISDRILDEVTGRLGG
jgi:hypothetical protein